jgi:uncharacterized membrane protein
MGIYEVKHIPGAESEVTIMDDATFLSRMVVKHNLHWHVILTHFPISFFTASAGFMMLHLFTNVECYELSSYLCLLAGVLMTLPTAITGWSTWKSKYTGARTKIFIYKIRISYLMIALGVLLILFRTYFVEGEHTLWHFVFGFGFLVLFSASMMEGYYGGRLNHR